MKRWWVVIGIVLIIIIAGFFIFPKVTDKIMRGNPSGVPGGSQCSSIQRGEWIPNQGECPGTTSEMQAKCSEFCDKHPDCCGSGENMDNNGMLGGRNLIALPSEEEISNLTRNYPSVIKAINEGPSIYGQGTFEIFSDEKLNSIKETGFNTIQLLVIDDCTGETCILDESSKAILLNDIVKAKQGGFAVWVALEFVNAPPGSDVSLPDYEVFKPAYLGLCKEVGELLENYKVEYYTVNNEPDLFLQEQTQWGTEMQIDEYVQEMFVSANVAAKETFNGKMINKITQVKKRPQATIDASFKNVDIASIDVGPPASEQLELDSYKGDFEEYQFYASQAQTAGVPWMVGEYWASNFMEDANIYVKQNQDALAQISFDAYLATKPSGVGYSWNEFATFSFEPNGEKTRLAIKEFFSKI